MASTSPRSFLVGAGERVPRGDEKRMQGLALGHLVVLVVLLGVIVVGLLEQRLELGDGFGVSGGGGFEFGVVRLQRIGLLDVLHAIRRVVDGVGAVDDALVAGRAAFRRPGEIARARLEGARRQPVDAADIGVHFRDRRRRLRGGWVRQGSAASGASRRAAPRTAAENGFMMSPPMPTAARVPRGFLGALVARRRPQVQGGWRGA